MDQAAAAVSRIEPTISHAFVSALCNAIEGHEDLVQEGLRKFELSNLDAEAPRIPLRRYIELFEWLAEKLQRPCLGLELSLQAGPETLGALGYMFLGARDLGTGIRSFGHFLQAVQDQSNLHLEIEGEYCHVHYEILDSRIRNRRQDSEYSLAFIWHLMQRFMAKQLHLTMVEFEHDRPEGGDGTHRRIFDAPVLFRRRFNRLHFRTSILTSQAQGLDPHLYPILEQQLQHQIADNQQIHSFTEQVESLLTQENLAEGIRAKQVADRLGISTATLHRRLRQEQTSFKSLSDKAAKTYAAFLIAQKSLSIATIANRLGYSETACLTRAFRRWFGKSPRDYRKSL